MRFFGHQKPLYDHQLPTWPFLPHNCFLHKETLVRRSTPHTSGTSLVESPQVLSLGLYLLHTVGHLIGQVL